MPVGMLLLATLAGIGSAAEQQFAVASIRRSDLQTMSPRPRMGPLVFFRRARLKELIALAYDLEKYQVIGEPKWIDEQSYDIEAKAETPASPSGIRVMLIALLRERFHLQVHEDTQYMSVYALAATAKRGKLTEAGPDTPRDGAGAIQVSSADVHGRGVTMRLLARYLSLELGRPVLDETGLEGHYDFAIAFGETKPSDASAESFGSLSYAIKDLGLKLESRKAPVHVLIVDGVDPPSEN